MSADRDGIRRAELIKWKSKQVAETEEKGNVLILAPTNHDAAYNSDCRSSPSLFCPMNPTSGTTPQMANNSLKRQRKKKITWCVLPPKNFDDLNESLTAHFHLNLHGTFLACTAEKVWRSECREIYLFSCTVRFLKSFKQNFRIILGKDIQEKTPIIIVVLDFTSTNAEISRKTSRAQNATGTPKKRHKVFKTMTIPHSFCPGT